MMRKLLIFGVLLLLSAPLMGSSSTTVSMLGQTMDYTTVTINYSINDTSNIVKVYLYWNGSLKDSVEDLGDSLFTVTGLMNGTTYPYYFVVMDTTGNDTSLIRNPSDGSVTTTDLLQTLTIPDSTITHAGATVWWNGVEADTGVATVALYAYTVRESLWAAGVTGDTVAPRMTITDTVSIDISAIVAATDTVYLCWSTTRADVADYSADWTDTSTGDSASASFPKTSLQPLTWYYYAGIACTSGVWDSLAIDSLYLAASDLPDTSITFTGFQEGDSVFLGTVAADSALTDTSPVYAFLTTDMQSTATATINATTITSIDISITTDTDTDFNGVDSVNLLEGLTSSSFTDVATLTLAETLTVTLDTTVIIAADSVFFFWSTNRDNVLELNGNYATDTTLTQTYSDDFIKTGLASATKYYYSAIACSVDVYDTIAIDSVITTGLSTAKWTRTGKFRGGYYYYKFQVFDSIYCDTPTVVSIYVPEIDSWDRCDYQLNWTKETSLPDHIIPVDGVETFYYQYYMTGATNVTDSLKLFVWDMTTGSAVAYDSSALLTLDTLHVAIDSVNCQDKKELKIGLVYRGAGTAASTVFGNMNLYIWTQNRPF